MSRKTAGTGTGCTKFLATQAEHFEDFCNFNYTGSNFQGVLAYLGWSLVFSGHYAALLPADFVSLSDFLGYLHWDVEIPAWGYVRSVHGTDALV